MKLSKRTEYGIRAMVWLATRWCGGQLPPVRMHELAAHEGLPVRFLGAIMTRLRHHKFVSSKPGSDGGYRLARPPHEILVPNLIVCLEAGAAFRPPPRRAYGSETIELVHDLDRLLTRQLRSAIEGLTLAELVRLAEARREQSGPHVYHI